MWNMGHCNLTMYVHTQGTKLHNGIKDEYLS